MAASRSKTSNQTLTLVVAIGAVAAFAAFAPAARTSAPVRAEPLPAAPESPADSAPPAWAHDRAEAPGAASPSDSRVSGQVLEQIDVAKYSYLRLGGQGAKDTWAAVPSTTSQLGKTVTVTSAQLMTQFESTSLKRTFDEIYFGVLQGAEAGNADAVDDAVRVAEADPTSPQQAPHPGAGRSADTVPVAACEKARGPLGRTVAELNARDPGKAGTQARVRATVVKATSGVMGRTFVHLRDGTGKAGVDNDLTATTTEELAVGSQVLLEGTIKIDEDFGSGYRYPVLLADARVVQP
jgi:hypothetical protein